MKDFSLNQTVRYIFFGACTTAVNLVSYYLLCAAGLNITVANTIAIFLAILFAYVVNKLFVFEHKTHSALELAKEAATFIGMRLGTMLVEVIGMLFLTCIWSIPNFIAKLLIQVIILVLNFLISKFVVFRDDEPEEENPEEVEISTKENSTAARSFDAESASHFETAEKAEVPSRQGSTAARSFHAENAAHLETAESKPDMAGEGLKTDEPGPMEAFASVAEPESGESPVTEQGSTEEPKKKHRLHLLKTYSPRWYFCAAFLLTLVIALIAFALVRVWPFGDKTLLIIDSLHQYLPFYTVFHEKLVDSESFLYSFSGGLGYNFWSTYAYYLASPLNFLMAFIPTKNVCDFMDLMILLKIALCGGCFSWYLAKRDEQKRSDGETIMDRPFLPVIFGLLFALSNFIIGYYFNLMWLDSIAMLPLMMYGIEQIVREKSGRFYCLALFYGLWCNYYIGFMLCIFACLYFVVRWVSRKFSWRALLKSAGVFAWHSLLAGGMAAIVLLPAFLGLTESEAMESFSFPTTLKFYQNLAELLENQMAFMTPINISNSQVGLNAYCGVATILLAVLYLFDGKIRLKERIAHYALVALLLFSFSCNILNYIWHGFHQQNGLPNRFAFLYIALLLLMAYDALGHLESFKLPFVFLAAAIPIGFFVWRLLTPEQEIEGGLFLITIGLLLLYFGLILIKRFAPGLSPGVFTTILAGVLLIEVTANAIYGVQENGSVTRSIYLDDQTSYQKLMAEVGADEEDGFYRSEVDRQRMRNVTMFVGGNAVVMFNSTMQGAFTDFCDSIGMESRTNKNGYLGVTTLMNDVFGIRYLASPSHKADTMYQFVKVASDANLALYENDDALSLGFMVSDDILDWDIHASNEPLEVQNDFVELATGLGPIYKLDRTIDLEDGGTYKVKVPEDKQVYLCLDTRVKEIDLTTPEYSKSLSDYTDHLYAINSNGDEDIAEFEITFRDNQSQASAEVYTCANADCQAVVDALARNQLENVVAEGNQVTGDISVDKAGTLLLTLPYDTGWELKVDGEVTEMSVVGSALIGIHLDEGEHSISMVYTPNGIYAGSAISVVSVVLFLTTVAVSRRRKRKIAA